MNPQFSLNDHVLGQLSESSPVMMHGSIAPLESRPRNKACEDSASFLSFQPLDTRSEADAKKEASQGRCSRFCRQLNDPSHKRHSGALKPHADHRLQCLHQLQAARFLAAVVDCVVVHACTGLQDFLGNWKGLHPLMFPNYRTPAESRRLMTLHAGCSF